MTNTLPLLNIVLTTATIFLFVILTISQGNTGIAQAQKTQDQIWSALVSQGVSKSNY